MCLGTLGIAPQLHFLLPILKGIEILPASLVMKTGLFIEILAMDNDPFQSAIYKTTIISTVVDINQPLSIVVDIKNNLIYEYTPVNHQESSCNLLLAATAAPEKTHPQRTGRFHGKKKHLSKLECLLETFPNLLQVISGQITIIPYTS